MTTEEKKLEEEFAFLRYKPEPSVFESVQTSDIPPEADEIIEKVMSPGTIVAVDMMVGETPYSTHTISDVRIKIERHYESVQIDIQEDNGVSQLVMLWNVLQEYGQRMNMDVKHDSSVETTLLLTFIPEEYAATIFLGTTNPTLWAFTADAVGEKTNGIRMIFLPDNVGIFKAEYDDEEDSSEPIQNFDSNVMSAEEYNNIYQVREQEKQDARREYYERYGPLKGKDER